MNVVDAVKQICLDAARQSGIADAEVIAPLPVWDGQGKSMGVQIKAPQVRGSEQQACEVVASFVLTEAELQNQAEIHRKAGIAVQAMQWDVQVQIRPVPKPKQMMLPTDPPKFVDMRETHGGADASD